MRRSALTLLLLLTACSAPAAPVTSVQPNDVQVPPVESGTTAAVATTTERHDPPAVSPPDPEDVAWSAAESERIVESYLAALAAGAWEQAAASADNNGIVFDGQRDDELPWEAIARQCAPDLCNGPYEIIDATVGLIDRASFQASALILVKNLTSGETGTIAIGTFEGQVIVGQLPPLAATAPRPGLVKTLFGDEVPARVVVQRFEAFEIWERGTATWVTNYFADETSAVMGDLISIYQPGPNRHLVSTLNDPNMRVEVDCPRLISVEQTALVVEQCWSTEARVIEPLSGADRSEIVPTPLPMDEVGYQWFDARGATVVNGVGDAEGNLSILDNSRGVNVMGDDYVGTSRLSPDGSVLVYVDHADPAAISHFHSPVVVTRDTATGAELSRVVLEGIVGCLEVSENWIVACEVAETDIAGELEQVALIAINQETVDISRVQTRVRLFLP